MLCGGVGLMDRSGKDAYCPYCQRIVSPSNTAEVKSGEHDGHIYIHDDVDHPDDFDPSDFEVMN